MNANTIPFLNRTNTADDVRPAASAAGQRAKVTALRRRLPTRMPTEETAGLIEDRGEELEDYFRWIRQAVWGYVSDWYELFAVAHKRDEQWYKRFAEVREKDLNELPRSTNGKKGLREVIEDAKVGGAEALYFWDRCAQIYGEEMQEAERLAAEARERAAQRIEKEFGNCDSGIPEALRANDPQGWARDLDWN